MPVFAHPFRWLSTQPACLPAKMSSSYNDLLRAFKIGESQYHDVCLRLESSQAVAQKAAKELEYAEETITELERSHGIMQTQIDCTKRRLANKVTSYDQLFAKYKSGNASNADKRALDEINAVKKERATLNNKLAKAVAQNNVLLIDMNHPVDQRVYEDLIKQRDDYICFQWYLFGAAIFIIFTYNLTWPFFYECHRMQ
jgi:hypothetical protein